MITKNTKYSPYKVKDLSLSEDQASYIGVEQKGPFKPSYYRY